MVWRSGSGEFHRARGIQAISIKHGRGFAPPIFKVAPAPMLNTPPAISLMVKVELSSVPLEIVNANREPIFTPSVAATDVLAIISASQTPSARGRARNGRPRKRRRMSRPKPVPSNAPLFVKLPLTAQISRRESPSR